MYLSIGQHALSSGGCRRQLLRCPYAHQKHCEKVLARRFLPALTSNSYPGGFRGNLQSVVFSGFSRLTPALTNETTIRPKNVSGTLELLRGLTAHEESAPRAEVFGNGE